MKRVLNDTKIVLYRLQTHDNKLNDQKSQKAFQLQVEEEERRARAEKSNKSGLFDAEAEEEEEEGRQAGLGDFGFGGVTSREADDEREALKVRKDDFKKTFRFKFLVVNYFSLVLVQLYSVHLSPATNWHV